MMFLYFMIWSLLHMNFFFFNDTATTEIYTLSLHDALPISDTAELDDIERRIRTLGFYSYRTSPEEHAKMAADEAYQSLDRKSTRLNSSHLGMSYDAFCLKKNNATHPTVSSKVHGESTRCPM